MKNNNVHQTREVYELHAFEYIRSLFPNQLVELNSTNGQYNGKFGSYAKDILIDKKITIEVKGAQPYNLGKELRVNRIILQEKDVHALADPDYYLFVFNLKSFGPGLFSNKCKFGCNNCSFQFILIPTAILKRHHIFKLNKSRTILPVTKIIKLYKKLQSTNSNELRLLDVKTHIYV